MSVRPWIENVEEENKRQMSGGCIVTSQLVEVNVSDVCVGAKL